MFVFYEYHINIQVCKTHYYLQLVFAFISNVSSVKSLCISVVWKKTCFGPCMTLFMKIMVTFFYLFFFFFFFCHFRHRGREACSNFGCCSRTTTLPLHQSVNRMFSGSNPLFVLCSMHIVYLWLVFIMWLLQVNLSPLYSIRMYIRLVPYACLY